MHWLYRAMVTLSEVLINMLPPDVVLPVVHCGNTGCQIDSLCYVDYLQLVNVAFHVKILNNK